MTSTGSSIFCADDSTASFNSLFVIGDDVALHAVVEQVSAMLCQQGGPEQLLEALEHALNTQELITRVRDRPPSN